MFRKSRKQLTIRFLQRTILFLTSFSGCLFFFFISGNMQDFLDDTQRMLLGVLAGSSLVTVLLAVLLLVSESYLLIMQKKRHYAFPMIVAFLCMVVSSVLTFFSHAVILLSRGF